MTQRTKVLVDRQVLPKGRVAALLSAGWARSIAKYGKGTFADKLEVSENTIGNALAQRTTPELHTALNSLTIDPTALDELFAGYGLRLCPIHSEAANDLATAAGVIGAMGGLVEALADGHRDHNETLAIAQLLRPHMPAVNAIIHEADQIRGAA
jgi:DNA-binding XRE family transcriptional regulator